MGDHKENKAEWLSVPQFGDWDMKGALPDYSMDFTKIREVRKQNKRDPSRASLGSEQELVSSKTRNPKSVQPDHPKYPHKHSSTASKVRSKHGKAQEKRSTFSYFICCLKA